MENLDSNKKDSCLKKQMHFNNNDNFFTRLKNNYGTFDIVNYLCLLGLIIGIILISFTARKFIEYALNDEGYKVWFGIIDRFTYQSNWLAVLFFILYFFNPGFQIFKGNKLLISLMVYIFFTFFGYNIVLVLISKDRGYVGSVFNVTNNVWTHILMPLYFVFFGLVKLWFKPDGEYKSFWSTLATGMIYPTIYCIYLISIPFIYRVEVETGVYETYTIYGNATNTKDRPTSWAYIMIMYLVFFPGSFGLFYYYKNLVNKFKK
ncbi:MAG: DUF1600 domain-containing protein [Mycoplasmoidaceae bacterium]